MNFIPAYTYNGMIYLNITNRCTNACSFCIIKSKEGVGSDLHLTREPEVSEILDAVEKLTISEEIIFCGFGEPLLRPDVVREVSKELKKRYNVKIRVNTNGLTEKSLGIKFLPELKGLVDIISISLNAQDSQTYFNICHPNLGIDSYKYMLDFAKESKKYIPRVVLSVVDVPGIDVEACRKIAQDLGTEFKVRSLIV